MFKVLFFGDIVGKIGRQGLKKALPLLKKKYKPDLILGNAENLAHGAGVTPKTLGELKEVGIDLFTSGNHVWVRPEVGGILTQPDPILLRPANYPPTAIGQGEKLIEVVSRKILVVNLVGRVLMDDNFDCPFHKIDEILEKYQKDNLSAILVDFHTEATSEKVAFGWYVDGRVSAVFGTHTHIPTADLKILPKGTAYVSDVGMVGAKESVIGIEKIGVLKKFLTQVPQPTIIPEEGICTVNAVVVEIDPKTKKALKILRVDQEVEI